jgi:hypothetical protein
VNRPSRPTANPIELKRQRSLVRKLIELNQRAGTLARTPDAGVVSRLADVIPFDIAPAKISPGS